MKRFDDVGPWCTEEVGLSGTGGGGGVVLVLDPPCFGDHSEARPSVTWDNIAFAGEPTEERNASEAAEVIGSG